MAGMVAREDKQTREQAWPAKRVRGRKEGTAVAFPLQRGWKLVFDGSTKIGDAGGELLEENFPFCIPYTVDFLLEGTGEGIRWSCSYDLHV